MATRLGELVGAKNGVNRFFATSTPYAPGSVAVRVADATLAPGDVSEIDPGGGLVSLAAPPGPDDLLLAAYADPEAGPSSFRSPSVAFVEQIALLSSQGANDFVIAAGQSGSLLAATIFDADGRTFDLRGSTLYFAARKDSESGAMVFDKTSNAPDPGVVPLDQSTTDGRGRLRVVFSAAETSDASGKVLAWDLWIKTPAGEVVPLVRGGKIEVRASIRTAFP